MDLLNVVGRASELFTRDIAAHGRELDLAVQGARFLVIGGAGSIGQAVAREIFRRRPRALHLVDISENDMVEVVRDIRSTLGYIHGDFRTFAIDCASPEFAALICAEGPYDYVLNLSALKHVRSEKDPYTLMRMLQVNIFNTVTTLRLAESGGARKYFCVSTDKAANPVNMMGASKRIMELFLMRESLRQPISTARFANVAFSNGSLLHGFNQRLTKRQPITAPRDVRRYFVTSAESGELCLLSCLLGDNRDIFFPKLSEGLNLITFAEIAQRYIGQLGYEPFECASEEEARVRAAELIANRKWPCYFFESDTTGEKDFEEFYTEGEELDMGRFDGVGVICNSAVFDGPRLDAFSEGVQALRTRGAWTKQELLGLFLDVLPEFGHKELGKSLDRRM